MFVIENMRNVLTSIFDLLNILFGLLNDFCRRCTTVE